MFAWFEKRVIQNSAGFVHLKKIFEDLGFTMNTNLPPLEHLYIHWPFCKNKCHYCDFVAFEKHEGFEPSYHQALLNEIKNFALARSHLPPAQISTMFLGGGTPSLYPLPLLEELFATLQSSFDMSKAEELVLEVNPGGLTHKHMETWKKVGINRLSVGVQVLDDAILYSLNRRQKNKDVFELMEMAPHYFSNISADFILGLPGVTQEIWERTLTTAMQWPITHISIYFLTIHEKTPLYFKVRRKELSLIEDDALVAEYERTVAFLAQHGFEQYEISNFAKKGFESKHNQSYWNRKPYQGFGIGAASFDGLNRTVNEKKLASYIDRHLHNKIDATLTKASAPFFEQLDKEQAYLEELMLGLRQKKGISLEKFFGAYSLLTQQNLGKKISQLEEKKLAVVNDGMLQLTVRGMALENEIVTHLSQQFE